MALNRKLSRWIVLLSIPVAIVSTYEVASGAPRLQIAGIDGEGPGDSIVLLSFSFSGPNSLQVTKQTDGTSAQLLQLVATGTHVSSMALTADSPGTGGVVFAFFDVIVTSFSSNGGGVPTETVAFSYARQTQARALGSATFGVRVTDLCTGKPVEGAVVQLTPVDSSTSGLNGESSKTGVFKFTSLGTGDYRLAVSAADHLNFEKVVAVVGARGQSETVALVPLNASGCL